MMLEDEMEPRLAEERAYHMEQWQRHKML